MSDLHKVEVGPEQRVVDSNGTLYVVGWDENGWFSITHVKARQNEYYAVGEYSTYSFPPGVAEDIAEMIL